MYEDSVSFSLGGMPVFAYGICIALGALAALLLLMRTSKRLPKGTAVCTMALALPCGILGARLLFCLLDFRFHDYFTLRALLSFWGGGLSMAGALLGACCGAMIAARLLRLVPLTLLDALVAPLLLFIAFARWGEGYTELLGRSRPLVQPFLQNSFLCTSDGYDAYLNTYMLEALTALILCGVLRCSKPLFPGDVLLCGMLLWGCTQVFWESLRFDAHMRMSFISFQQILYACMFAVPLLFFAHRYAKARQKKWPVPCMIALMIALAGAVIGLEFLIDRSGINRILLYLVYALLLCLPIAAGLNFRKRSLLA